MKRVLILALIFSFLQVSSAADDKDEEMRRALAARPTVSKCGKRYAILALNLSLGAVAATGAVAIVGRSNFHHTVAGLFSSKHHIGYGIYLDKQAVVDKLTPAEKELLKDPEKNRDAIIEMFNAKLVGGYDVGHLRADPDRPGSGERRSFFSTDFFWGIDGEQFFDTSNPKRGVCRHKAVLLEAMLNHVGIEARYVSCVMGPIYAGQPESDRQHAVVYIPKTDQMADPTANTLSGRKEWEERTGPRYLSGFKKP